MKTQFFAVPSQFLRGKTWLRTILKRLGVLIVLLAAVAPDFVRLLDESRTFAVFQDNTYYFAPLFSFVSRSIAEGSIPYYIPHLVGGLPLYDSPLFSFSYPLYLFHAGLYRTGLDCMFQLHWVTLLHIALLAVNSYVFFRCLPLGNLSSALAALLFATSSFFVNMSSHVDIVAAYSWFPLVAAGVLLVCEQRHVIVGIVVGATAAALMALAKASQELIQTAYFCGALYLLYAVPSLCRNRWAVPLTTARNLTVLAILALLLSSPVVVPVVLDTARMTRWLGEFEPISGYQRIPFEAMLVGQHSPGDFARTLFRVPVLLSAGDLFIGIMPFFLALLAFCRQRQRPLVLFLALVAGYGLVSAAGQHLGLAQLNFHLPLLNKIREPGYHLFFFMIGSSALAGIGFQLILERQGQGWRWLSWRGLWASLIIVMAVSIACCAIQSACLPSLTIKPVLGILLFFALLFFGLPHCRGAWQKSIALVLAVLVVGVHQMQVDWTGTCPRASQGDYQSAANQTSHRVLAQLSTIPGIKQYRVILGNSDRADSAPGDDIGAPRWSMNASYYGLRTFGGYFSPMPTAQFDEIYHHNFKVNGYYEILGGKYLLCRDCDPAAIANYEYQSTIEGYKLYASARALPRVFLSGSIAGTYKDRPGYEAALVRGFDFSKALLVREEDLSRIPDALATNIDNPPTDMLNIQRDSDNQVVVTCHARGPRIVVLNEFYGANWTASIDGERIDTFPVNLNQVAILINGGDHIVKFEYRPLLREKLEWIQKSACVFMVCFALWNLGPKASQTFRKLRSKSK